MMLQEIIETTITQIIAQQQNKEEWKEWGKMQHSFLYAIGNKKQDKTTRKKLNKIKKMLKLNKRVRYTTKVWRDEYVERN